VITTLLSFVIFAGIYLLVTSGLTLEDIPLPSPPGFD
jgi:predicted secreted protein